MKRIVFALAVLVLTPQLHGADGAQVRRKATETVKAGKQYTYDKKNEFEGDVRAQLKNIDRQLNKIHDDASARGRQEWSRLQAQRDDLSKRLDEISKSTSSAWSQVRNGVSSAMDDLQKSIRKATDNFKSH